MMQQAQIKEYLEVLTLLAGISAIVFKVSDIQRQVAETIDKVSDTDYARYAELDARLRIHIAECAAKEKHFNSCLRELKRRTELNKQGREECL